MVMYELLRLDSPLEKYPSGVVAMFITLPRPPAIVLILRPRHPPQDLPGSHSMSMIIPPPTRPLHHWYSSATA